MQGDSSKLTDIVDQTDEVDALLQAAFDLAAGDTSTPDKGLLAVVSVAQQKVGEISEALTTLLKGAAPIAA
jgi:hypothetical protein